MLGVRERKVYKFESQRRVRPCPIGKYYETGSDICLVCVTASVPESVSCDGCQAGTFGDTNRGCQNVQRLVYPGGNVDSCFSVRLGTILAGSHVLHVKLADIPQEPHPMKHYAKCAQQACTERDQE